MSRESPFPWDPARERRAPSDMVVQTIAYNDGLIEQVARFSAMQAMPILLANGERATLSQQTDRLRELIEELVRRAIDDGDGHQQDMVGIFNVELIIAEQNGDGFTDQAKNRYVLAVDVSIPLEHSVLPFPPKFYAKGRKIVERWFGEE